MRYVIGMLVHKQRRLTMNEAHESELVAEPRGATPIRAARWFRNAETWLGRELATSLFLDRLP